MQRKAPEPAGGKPRMAVKVPEDTSNIKYPKDITGTILLCADANIPARPPLKLLVSYLCGHCSLHTQEEHFDAHGGQDGNAVAIQLEQARCPRTAQERHHRKQGENLRALILLKAAAY
jgi:hypothetical protein